MNRKLTLLTLALLALAVALSTQLRQHYRETKAHERAILQQAARPAPVLAPPSIAPPAPVAAAQYLDVAQHTLFSKDRNPTVIVEPPAPKPEPPMPALPVYYGQMSFGDPAILLSINGGAQKRFHKGEKVGAFEVLAFDADKITLRWNEKNIEKKLNEMKPKEDQPEAVQSSYRAPAPPQSSTPTGGVQIKNLSAANDSDKEKPKPDPLLGIDRGDGFYGCNMNENSPAGTEAGGYRKVISRGLMGNSCYWEKIKK